MKIETKKLPKNILEAKIILGTEEMKPFYSNALQKIADSTTLAGFRPGKAPLYLVKQEIGDYKILEEAVSLAIEKKYEEILKKLEIEIATPPKLEIVPLGGIPHSGKKIALGNELIFKLIFALIPKIKLTNYKKIKIKKEKPEIKEEEIKKILENLQESRATQLRKNMSAQKGDLVKADVEMLHNLVPLEHGQGKDAAFILGKDYYLAEFSQNLIGAKEGDLKKFTLTYPSNYPDKKLASKKIDFKVKIKEIFELKLPKLNDSFAQNLGNYKNMEELKNQIKNNLLTEKERKIEEKYEIRILEEITKQSEFEEIPEILIEKEIAKMMVEMNSSVKNMLGLEFIDYLNMIKKTEDELKKEFVPQAEERIKTALVVREIAFREKIKAEEKEVEAEKEKIIQTYADKKNIIDSLETAGFKKYLENMIINRKTIEYLKGFVSPPFD